MLWGYAGEDIGTLPVGTFPSTGAFGVFDIIGNVWEMCYEEHSLYYGVLESIVPSNDPPNFTEILVTDFGIDEGDDFVPHVQVWRVAFRLPFLPTRALHQ